MLIVLAAFAGAAAPTADLAEEADLLFRRGVEAYAQGDLELALERLLASERLVANRNVTFNVARCYETLGRLDQAWRRYAAYVEAEPDPAARAEAEQALARLDPEVARVSVQTDPPGATVYVQRRDLGTRGVTPLVLALPPGEHTLLVEREGSSSASAVALLARGELASVDLQLQPLEAPPPPPAPPARWTGTTVAAGDLVLAVVGPGSCALLPEQLEGAGRPLDGAEPAEIRGSMLQLAEPRAGLTVDTVHDGRPVRARLTRADKRALALSDSSPLHATLFARCAPTDPGGLAELLGRLPSSARPDLVAVLAEWAAWRGASDVPAVAEQCAEGQCEPLVAALVR